MIPPRCSPFQSASALTAFNRHVDQLFSGIAKLRKSSKDPYSIEICAVLQDAAMWMGLLPSPECVPAKQRDTNEAMPILMWIREQRDPLEKRFAKSWSTYVRRSLDLTAVPETTRMSMALEREFRFWGLIVPIVANYASNGAAPVSRDVDKALKPFMVAAADVGKAANLLRADPYLERAFSYQELWLLAQLPRMMDGLRKTFELIVLKNIMPTLKGGDEALGTGTSIEIAEVFYRSFGHCSWGSLQQVMELPDLLIPVPPNPEARLGERIGRARFKVAWSNKRRNGYDMSFPPYIEESLHRPVSIDSPWLGGFARRPKIHSLEEKDNKRIDKHFTQGRVSDS